MSPVFFLGDSDLGSQDLIQRDFVKISTENSTENQTSVFGAITKPFWDRNFQSQK